MSSHEVWETHNGPCVCGKGRIIIETISYNQMYGGTDSQSSITCPACNSGYVIGKGGLISKAEQAASAAQIAESHRLREGIRRDFCEPIAAELETRVRTAGRTKVAWLIELAKYGLPQSIGSSSLSSHLRTIVAIDNVAAVAEAMGLSPDKEMDRRIAEWRVADAAITWPKPIPLPRE